MTDYEIYNLIVCLVVFVVLAALSVICITAVVKLYLRLIGGGQEDDNLITEYQKLNKKRSKAGDIFAAVFNALIFIIFAAVFVFAIVLNTQDAATSNTMATFRVVKSDSMSEKYSGNTYLTNADNAALYDTLDYQFDTFDIILTYKTPDEDDLQLYDVIVYEYDGELIIHRIVGIEEANSVHEGRLFTLRGDANAASDAYQVSYSQIKGIYRGEHVRFVGSIVLFFQSPAGWLCIILIAAAVIISPVVESHIGKRKYRRLVEIGVIADEKLLGQILEENALRGANYGGATAAPTVNGGAVVLSAAEGPRGSVSGSRETNLSLRPLAVEGLTAETPQPNYVAVSVENCYGVQSYVVHGNGTVSVANGSVTVTEGRRKDE